MTSQFDKGKGAHHGYNKPKTFENHVHRPDIRRIFKQTKVCFKQRSIRKGLHMTQYVMASNKDQWSSPERIRLFLTLLFAYDMQRVSYLMGSNKDHMVGFLQSSRDSIIRQNSFCSRVIPMCALALQNKVYQIGFSYILYFRF